MATTTEPRLVVTGSEQRQAVDFLQAVDGHVERVVVPSNHDTTVPVPDDVARIIARVLDVMANGGTVTISSMPEELTSTVAARQLGISRPTLMKLIRSGEIPAHKVGTHHRLKFGDVAAFKRTRLERQRAALEELRRIDEELESF